MNAPVGINQLGQRFEISGTQLPHLPVFENIGDDLMLSAQFFQYGVGCGKCSFRSLSSRLETEGIKKDSSHLLAGTDVKRLTGALMDNPGEFVNAFIDL
ncbi:hypothetical protein ADUPG1_004106, partial [Aduncisulcus paluster]